MSRSAQRQTIIRERSTGGDWTTPDLLVIHGVSLQPLAGTADPEHAPNLLPAWQLTAIGYPDIQAGDRIRCNEGTLDVPGPVQRWPGHRPETTATTTLHIGDATCRIDRWTGPIGWDPGTESATSAKTTVYTGRIALAAAASSPASTVDEPVVAASFACEIDWTVLDLQIGDLVTITDSPDPVLVGQVLAVTAVGGITVDVARRFTAVLNR